MDALTEYLQQGDDLPDVDWFGVSAEWHDLKYQENGFRDRTPVGTSLELQ